MNYRLNKLLLMAAGTAIVLGWTPQAGAGPFTSKFQNGAQGQLTAENTADDSKPAAKRKHARHKGKHKRGMRLSKEDHQRMQAIHQRLKDNPELQKACAAVKNADSKEAKKAAWKQLKQVRQSVLTTEEKEFFKNFEGKGCPALKRCGKKARCQG